jgi:hypothetical protein
MRWASAGSQFTQRMEGICLFFRKINRHIYCSLKHSLWGWQYVDWCRLDSRLFFFTYKKKWWDLPWCIGGDFKVTSFPIERSVEAHFCPAMVEFIDFIVDHGLLDNPFVGGNATWSNYWLPPTWSRIDRFLVSPDSEA